MPLLLTIAVGVFIILLFFLFYRRYSPDAVQKRNAYNRDFWDRHTRISDAIEFCFRKDNLVGLEENISDLKKQYDGVLEKAGERCDALMKMVHKKRKEIVRELNKERRAKF